MDSRGEKHHSSQPAVDPIDAFVRNGGKDVDWAAFGGQKINKWQLSQCDPGGTKGNIVDKMLGEPWRTHRNEEPRYRTCVYSNEKDLSTRERQERADDE